MSSRNPEDDFKDDVAVRRERIQALTDPPVPKSTFFDWVKKGKVVRAKGLRGYYLLNKTRKKLGLPQVDVSRQPETQDPFTPNSDRSLTFLALGMIVQEALSVFVEEEVPELITMRDFFLVEAIVRKHKPALAEIKDPVERLAYVGGALAGCAKE